MKKLIFTFLLTLTSIFVYSQVDVVNHFTGNAAFYVGWDKLTGIPLNIRHEARQNIQFYTDSTFRGLIDSLTGFWGVGTPTPLSVLHVDTITNSSAIEIFRTVSRANSQALWKMFRGGLEYGRIYNRNDNDLYIHSPSGHMRFYTGTSTQRAIITDQGDIGIGSNFSNPSSRVHMHNSGTLDLYFQISTGSGNNNAIDGFRIGVMNPGGTGTFDVELRQQEAADMNFFTGDNNAATHYRRMRLTSGTGLNLNGSGAIANITNISKTVIERGGGVTVMQAPRAMLNIGSDAGMPNVNVGGWRTWMDVGTFSILGTDNMYSGLKIEPNTVSPFPDDRYDAVISWGDNDALQAGGCCGPDNLRFIYTTTNALDGSPEAQWDGSEIARMTPDGLVGIGNFTQGGAGGGSGVQPLRRLEIYDQRFNSNTPNGAPQLRLTFTPATAANPITTGLWTDFQTTSRGDFYIHPDSLGIDKKVGINDSTPGNTLEINGTPGISPELAGLRFTDLINTVTPVNNPTRGVLSVDNDGDVIWVRDSIGTGAGGNICPAGLTQTNYITKITNPGEICATTNIYEEGTTGPRAGNVGIRTSVPLESFHNRGTSLFEKFPFNANPLTPSRTYPLGVLTFDTALVHNRGIGLFNTDRTESLNITNVWGGGWQTNSIESKRDADLVFRTEISESGDTTWREAVMAIHGQSGRVFIKDSLLMPTGQMIPPANNDNARLVVEDDDASNSMTAAIIGRNIEVINAASDGIVGECRGVKTGSSGENRGGYFNGANADRSFGVYATSDSVFASPNRNRENHGGYFEAKNGETNFAGKFVAGENQTGGGVVTNYGVYTVAQGAAPTDTNYGTYSEAAYALSNYAGNFWAHDGDSASYGVRARAEDSKYNFGGHFNAVLGTGGAGGVVYGIYAAGDNSACVDTPGTCFRAAAYFNGDVFCTADYVGSDSTIKDNLVELQPLDTAIANSVTGYSFTYNQTGFPSLNLPSGTHFGFIAEQVQVAFPNMVKPFKQPAAYDALGNMLHPEVEILAVNYKEFIPLLWNADKQQRQEIDSLKIKLTMLEQQMAACCLLSPKTENPTNSGSIELQNVKTLQLFSADPNPFKESTWVRWSIPEDFQNATIYFYDNFGNQINTYKISEKGNGELQVFGSKLSAGIYTYSLVVDGKVIDSKKMVKAK